MDIAKDIFKRSRVISEKLIPYGFTKEHKKYVLSKNILDNTFQVCIEIFEDALPKVKVYDLSFNEEYINYKIESETGEFVNTVRHELIKILTDIKDKCTITNYFISDQANRLASLILEKYNDTPEFAWEKFPLDGIFKNPANNKWYGLIMNINKSKIVPDSKDRNIDILNVKLDEELIKSLLTKKGFYPAYHMNKKNWLTIPLDDTFKDEEIMSYIEESHKFTESTNSWIIPANPKYYDIINCFNDTDTIIFNQQANVSIHDLVYIYVASPYSTILYKCEVQEINIPYEYTDKFVSMTHVMKIKLLEKYDKDKYTLEKLKKYGINAVRAKRSMPKKLSAEINK